MENSLLLFAYVFFVRILYMSPQLATALSCPQSSRVVSWSFDLSTEAETETDGIDKDAADDDKEEEFNADGSLKLLTSMLLRVSSFFFSFLAVLRKTTAKLCFLWDSNCVRSPEARKKKDRQPGVRPPLAKSADSNVNVAGE